MYGGSGARGYWKHMPKYHSIANTRIPIYLPL